eukprot:868251-Prymnesium_polylepis.3
MCARAKKRQHRAYLNSHPPNRHADASRQRLHSMARVGVGEGLKASTNGGRRRSPTRAPATNGAARRSGAAST